MSAGFKYGEQARARFGADDAFAVFLHEEWEGFSTGKVVYLDRILTDAGVRQRFLVVLERGDGGNPARTRFHGAGGEMGRHGGHGVTRRIAAT